MTIIESIKQLIGYTGNDLDSIFAIISIILVIYFIFTLFNIIISFFPQRRRY